MNLEKANELLATQALMGNGYNRYSTKLILAEVQREHSQQVVDSLTGAMEQEIIFEFKPGTEFKH